MIHFYDTFDDTTIHTIAAATTTTTTPMATSAPTATTTTTTQTAFMTHFTILFNYYILDTCSDTPWLLLLLLLQP